MKIKQITNETENQINKIIPKNHYLINNSQSHKILKQLQLSNNNNIINSKCLQFLLSKKLITIHQKITPLGNAVLLTHVFDVDLLSLFLLAHMWDVQKSNPDKMFCTKPSLLNLLYMYDKKTMDNHLSQLKKRDFLLYSNKYNALKISPDTFTKLNDEKIKLLEIIEFINKLHEQIQSLIREDPIRVKLRKETSEALWMLQ